MTSRSDHARARTDQVGDDDDGRVQSSVFLPRRPETRIFVL